MPSRRGRITPIRQRESDNMQMSTLVGSIQSPGNVCVSDSLSEAGWQRQRMRRRCRPVQYVRVRSCWPPHRDARDCVAQDRQSTWRTFQHCQLCRWTECADYADKTCSLLVLSKCKVTDICATPHTSQRGRVRSVLCCPGNKAQFAAALRAHSRYLHPL